MSAAPTPTSCFLLPWENWLPVPWRPPLSPVVSPPTAEVSRTRRPPGSRACAAAHPPLLSAEGGRRAAAELPGASGLAAGRAQRWPPPRPQPLAAPMRRGFEPGLSLAVGSEVSAKGSMHSSGQVFAKFERSGEQRPAVRDEGTFASSTLMSRNQREFRAKCTCGEGGKGVREGGEEVGREGNRVTGKGGGIAGKPCGQKEFRHVGRVHDWGAGLRLPMQEGCAWARGTRPFGSPASPYSRCPSRATTPCSLSSWRCVSSTSPLGQRRAPVDLA